MKQIVAGLILFIAIGAAAQTSNKINSNTQKKLTPGKMREVILADERQHEAKAPGSINTNVNYNAYKTPAGNRYQVVKTNYVTQHRNALLEGLGTALYLSKGITPYGSYYRAPTQ